MDPMLTEPAQAAVDLWRLRRNLTLSPEERLVQLRVWQRWMAQYRGLAGYAVQPRREAAGH